MRIIELSNESRYTLDKSLDENWLREATVIKVGKKYITVKCGCREIKFDVTNNFREGTKHSDDYKLYINKQEALDDVYDARLCRLIAYSNFDKLSLSQRIRIYDVIKEGKPDD